MASELAGKLKDSGCYPIICLSHLGYDDPVGTGDIQLVRSLKNTDLVIGGHSHTFLRHPKHFRDADGKPVQVAQAGWAGLKHDFNILRVRY